ncbi:hypothetical protein ACJX0J_019053 [Zea mays]
MGLVETVTANATTSFRDKEISNNFFLFNLATLFFLRLDLYACLLIVHACVSRIVNKIKPLPLRNLSIKPLPLRKLLFHCDWSGEVSLLRSPLSGNQDKVGHPTIIIEILEGRGSVFIKFYNLYKNMEMNL